jgi:Flp pilus assembly protein TadD
MATDLQLEQQKMSIQQQKDTSQLQNEQFKQQAENERTIAEITARERMNTADNETAMLLAAAEMSTGEKVAVSTGTGINPNP